MFFLVPWGTVIRRNSATIQTIQLDHQHSPRIYKVDGRSLAVGALLFNSKGRLLVGQRTLKWGHGKVFMAHILSLMLNLTISGNLYKGD